MGHGHGEDRQRIARVYYLGISGMKIHLHFCMSLGSRLNGEQINKIHVYTYIPQAYRQTPMGRPKFNYCLLVLIESLALVLVYTYLIPWASLSRPNRRVSCLTYLTVTAIFRPSAASCWSPIGAFPLQDSPHASCVSATGPGGKAPNFVISKQEGPGKGEVINCNRYEAKERDMDRLSASMTHQQTVRIWKQKKKEKIT
ncbi:hypothetical protein V8C40DRAFT_245568 [Trichoderma camerunense]